MAAFADHFSSAAGDYVTYRPHYPVALFDWLARQAPARGRAWDCGTGSGQAAIPLASHFGAVIATDPSVSQLAHADGRFGVHYAAMTAEQPGIASQSIALITVAQALHWFDRDQFYSEATRILMRGGILAAWCYRLAIIDPDIDALIGRFHAKTVGPYWPPERAFVDAGYSSLSFPFDEREVPPFYMEARWTLRQLAGYLSTWSAVGRYRASRGSDPMPSLMNELIPLWGDPPASRLVRWPLDVRAGMRG